jgi:hypothetical protein
MRTLTVCRASIAFYGILATASVHAQNSAPAAQTRTALSTSRTADEVTFAKHIAPILQQKCQVCHQPGSIAPMSLMTYDDVREYGDKIKARVAARIMPPWHIDRTVGIQQFKNDRGLTDDQISTLVRWVDAGMPFGRKEDLPAPVKFLDPTGWQNANQFGNPDLVLKSPTYTMPPRTQDKWFRPVTETGLTEERWVRAIEIRPATPDSRKAVHHVLTLLEQEEHGLTNLASSAHGAQMTAGLFMEWSIGKSGEIFPTDAGKLLLPGSKIRWEVHMFAIGKETKDNQVEMAIWFYPKGVVPKHRTVLRMFDVSRGEDLDIRPGEMAMTQNFYVMPAPARLENFQPHMHMRGKAMSMQAVYPDGRKEVLSVVNNFQWKWHVNYVYADGAQPLLPKGTMLVFTAWHDNTAQNPNNPDPLQWVGWGDRTVDEMAHAWIDVTYLEQAEFDSLMAVRKPKPASGRRP